MDVNITLNLIRLKMEAYKEHIRHCLLFCFQKKSTDAHRIICETCGKNIVTIRTCAKKEGP